MPLFTCQNLLRRDNGEGHQWYSPSGEYDCNQTIGPIEFEARCFFDAVERTWPWIRGRMYDWHFQVGHEENTENSRVYRFDDEEETFKITKVG